MLVGVDRSLHTRDRVFYLFDLPAVAVAGHEKVEVHASVKVGAMAFTL